MVRAVLLLLTVAGLVAAAGWLVFFSSVLAVERVEVEGAGRVGDLEVTDVAAVPMGAPLARVSLEGVEGRVESGLPEVAEATASRTWPNTLSIEVRERIPVAVVDRAGSWWLVDATGMQYREVDTAPAGLPVVRSADDPSAPDVATRDAAGAAAVVIAGLPADLADRLRSVDAATADSITLHLTRGVQVMWGSSTDSARKAEVLAVLLDTGHRLPGEVYDVSVPGSPTVSAQ